MNGGLHGHGTLLIIIRQIDILRPPIRLALDFVLEQIENILDCFVHRNLPVMKPFVHELHQRTNHWNLDRTLVPLPMATRSRIEWTEHTWNPITGCSNVSPGCKHCYARIFAERLKAMGAPGYVDGFAVTLQPDRLREPLKRKIPTLYFVNSMSDLFHEQVPFNYIDRVLAIIDLASQHQFQILTKRANRMAEYFATRPVPLNAWLGVSVENRKHGVPRIAPLVKIEARIRFLSVEPLIDDPGKLPLQGIHWVIVGGESGRGARPMKPEWVRKIRDQCLDAGVPFFFKQWGAWGPDGIKRSKKANARSIDSQQWSQLPQILSDTKGERVCRTTNMIGR
jgi:protein gp37